MMNDDSSDDAKSMGARVTEVGEAIGERVQSATAATAAVAEHAEKLVADATAATTAAASQANKVLGAAGETAQQAGEAVGDVVVDAGRHAHRSVSRQIHENLVMAILVGCTLGYVAGWWIHGGSRPRKIAED
jgi:hypothetical protein